MHERMRRGRQVNYINAHATSTLVGDVAEVKAIKAVFSDVSHIKINGTKSLIGHCLGAAGGMEAIATIQAIRTGYVHPTLNQARSAVPRAGPRRGSIITRTDMHAILYAKRLVVEQQT